MLADITWRPGIGDRNPLAWCITTVVYFVACWLCLSAGRSNRAAPRNCGESRLGWLWSVFAGMMFLLGVNKQLDLQTLLTQCGREMARQGGWYEQRRDVQKAFICGCAVFCIVCATVGIVTLRAHWRQFGVAYLGIVGLITFIVIRAASLHHVDVLLYRLSQVGNWMNFGLELGGTLLVAFGAFLATRHTSSRDASLR